MRSRTIGEIMNYFSESVRPGDIVRHKIKRGRKYITAFEAIVEKGKRFK